MNGTLLFCKYRLRAFRGGVGTQTNGYLNASVCLYSDSTCNQICLSFLHSCSMGMPEHLPLTCLCPSYPRSHLVKLLFSFCMLHYVRNQWHKCDISLLCLFVIISVQAIFLSRKRRYLSHYFVDTLKLYCSSKYWRTKINCMKKPGQVFSMYIRRREIVVNLYDVSIDLMFMMLITTGFSHCYNTGHSQA